MVTLIIRINLNYPPSKMHLPFAALTCFPSCPLDGDMFRVIFRAKSKRHGFSRLLSGTKLLPGLRNQRCLNRECMGSAACCVHSRGIAKTKFNGASHACGGLLRIMPLEQFRTTQEQELLIIDLLGIKSIFISIYPSLTLIIKRYCFYVIINYHMYYIRLCYILIIKGKHYQKKLLFTMKLFDIYEIYCIYLMFFL